jgi:hypothetical protein
MVSLFDWLPQLLVGCTFAMLGLLKLYGVHRGIEGGGRKPFVQRLCGT